jgi:hypothetical protein
MRFVVSFVAVAALLAAPSAAQQQRAQAKKPAAPTPHWPDGRVNLGPPPGGKGHWNTGVGNLSENFVEMNGAFLVHPEDIDKVAPFQPWAKAIVQYRLDTLGKDDPHPRCIPPAGPRQFNTPYGLEIVDQPELKRILVLSGGGSRSWRVIHMDGRPHPTGDDVNPTYYGHSVGRWEGDTLVVDTVGFNERFWMTRRPTGMVHTDRLHLIERISRPDFNTLHYEVTIDDPGAYTRPWTAKWDIPWTEDEVEEYFCQDNNRDTQHLVGATPE